MAVHINYGYAKRRTTNRPRCMYCDRRRTWVAFTYFGAPVCGECWDTRWRHPDEEGACDPPFDAITREQTGEWVMPA